MKDRWGEFTLCSGFEGSGKCWWCGGEFPDKRARRYCSETCSDEYYRHFYWAWAKDWALERADSKCEECGVSRSHYDRELGRVVGVFLEVHHKDPLGNEPRHFNIKNRPENLQVLCPKCHGKKRRKPQDKRQLILIGEG